MVLIYYVSCVQKIDSAWCAARIQFIIIIPIKAFQRKPRFRLVHVFLLSFCICSFHLPVSIFPCAWNVQIIFRTNTDLSFLFEKVHRVSGVIKFAGKKKKEFLDLTRRIIFSKSAAAFRSSYRALFGIWSQTLDNKRGQFIVRQTANVFGLTRNRYYWWLKRAIRMLCTIPFLWISLG